MRVGCAHAIITPAPGTPLAGFGAIGHVPPATAFEGGGYETRLAPSSGLAPEVEPVVVDAALDLLAHLRGLQIAWPDGRISPCRARRTASAFRAAVLHGILRHPPV